jgi:hypothetical protein
MSNQRDPNAFEYDGNSAIPPIEGNILSGVLLYDRGRFSSLWTHPCQLWMIHITHLLPIPDAYELERSQVEYARLFFICAFRSFLGDSV